MKTSVVIILFTLILCTVTFGQDYAFKVLANKGNNEVKSGDSWMPVKTGASLKATDELKLADNSYMGLVSSNGKPLELKQAGNYKISALTEKVKEGSSVLVKYTDFILSSNAEVKKNKLSATGAVHRDPTMNYPIKLMLPENQHSGIYNNTAVISWEGNTRGAYVVFIENIYEDKVIEKIETTQNSIEINLSDPKYNGETALMVQVKSKDDNKLASKKHLIKRLEQTDQNRIKKSLNEIIGEVAENTALNKFILAGFYEENNLFIDAIAAYEETIKLAPDVPYYKESYDEFLLRHGLKK